MPRQKSKPTRSSPRKKSNHTINPEPKHPENTPHEPQTAPQEPQGNLNANILFIIIILIDVQAVLLIELTEMFVTYNSI